MDAIPVVDLRLLTQAEINALSRAASSSFSTGDPRRRDDDIVVPKIDRSVFNESAGSRKQTYSRLRLAPGKPPDLSSPSPSSSSGAAPRRGRGRPPSSGLLAAPSPSSAPLPAPLVASDDPGREENKQIILFLRQLFKKNDIEIGDAAAANEERAAVPGTSIDANPNCIGSALGKRVREQHAAEAMTKDREVLSVNGVAVDLFELGEKEDPFGPELKRRTQGLVTEDEFLGFLSGLEGQWGSRRKRRRIVDAAKFGNTLPSGWKVLLALKRKEGNVWLHCRRYISPSGKQFISCKEVSSYLLSFNGSQEGRQQNAAQNNANKLGNEHQSVCHSHQVNITSRSPSCSAAMPISTISCDPGKQTGLSGVENPANAQPQIILKCQECNLTFADRGTHLQHLLTVHTSSRKRRRLGQSIGDGVIMRDGKYECQFCHKTFTERRRYTGHVGIHVKYHSKSLVPVTNEITLDKNIASSSDGAASSFGEHSISVDYGRHAKLIEENLSTKLIPVINDGHPHGDEPIANIVTDHTLKCYDNETEKIMVHEICTTGDIGGIKNCLPLSRSCDIDEERNVMQEMCPLPNDEMNEGSPQNNVSLENRKMEHNMKCSDIEGSSVQELCNTQCNGDEINDGSLLSNNQNKLKNNYVPISNNETSESRFIDNLANDCGVTNQKPRETVETGNNVNSDVHTCLGCTSLPLPDVGNSPSEGPLSNQFSNNKPIDEMDKSSRMEMTYERHSVGVSDGLQTTSEGVMSSGFVIDGAENSENKICLSSNVNILSGKEQNNTRNYVSMCTTEELAEMAKSGNESQNDADCMNTSDVAFSLDNIVHGKIQSSGTEKRLLEDLMMIPSGNIYCDIDTATGDMLHSTGEEIMLDIMDQSSNGLKDDFISDDTVLDADSLGNDIGISDEQNMQNLLVNMQASWGSTSAHLPIPDMITGQAHGNVHPINQNHEKISCSKDTRLEKIKPQKSVFSTNQESRRRLEEQNAYTPMVENGLRPCVQLEWDLASPSLGFRRRITTYCVWCGAEFEHDDIEVQPDSVGLMCPTCKAKISGQI